MTMLQTERQALHYEVIANTAHKVEKIAKELSTMYNSSYFYIKECNTKKEHLKKYMKQLEELINNSED